MGRAEFSLIGREQLGDLASLAGLPSQGFEEPPKKPARKKAKKKKKPAAALGVLVLQHDHARGHLGGSAPFLSTLRVLRFMVRLTTPATAARGRGARGSARFADGAQSAL